MGIEKSLDATLVQLISLLYVPVIFVFLNVIRKRGLISNGWLGISFNIRELRYKMNMYSKVTLQTVLRESA